MTLMWLLYTNRDWLRSLAVIGYFTKAPPQHWDVLLFDDNETYSVDVSKLDVQIFMFHAITLFFLFLKVEIIDQPPW